MFQTSTISKRQHVWVCWQEPELDRGKFSLIPTSWIAKSITGDGSSPGSLVLCRWPRSEDLFTAKIIHDPTPNDLAQVEVMEVPMFMEENAEMDSRKSMNRKGSNQSMGGAGKSYNGGASSGADDGMFVLSQLKRFFLTEMTKMSGEMQANFDILGHRIGALEVNMKCVRERVERIENLLNTAAHDFETSVQDRNSSNYMNLTQSTGDNDDNNEILNTGGGMRSKIKTETSATSQRSSQDGSLINKRMPSMEPEEEMDDMDDPSIPKPTIIPRPCEQRVRKDRNPRPRAIVVTCPKNKNIVYLGGDERFRMPVPTYLDAIRHAKRPTATYMVTALLRRYLPPATLSRLCVNERQLANTNGGQMVDHELLDALKKQGRMQFPHTSVVDRELMLRIEDVTRDVRRKIKVSSAIFRNLAYIELWIVDRLIVIN